MVVVKNICCVGAGYVGKCVVRVRVIFVRCVGSKHEP